MPSIRQTLHSRSAVPMAAASMCLALAAGPAQAVLVTTYHTGAVGPGPAPLLLPNGAIDPHYVRVSSVGIGANPGPVLGSASVKTIVPGTWLAPGGVSEWIEPDANFNGTPVQFNGIHYYETSFNLSGFVPGTALMAGNWATAFPIGAVYLNGVNLFIANGSYTQSGFSNQWNGLSGTGPLFNSFLNFNGANYLTFEVNNIGPVPGQLTGLRVEYRIDALPVPEPSTYAMFALGLAGLGLARWRRLAEVSNRTA